MFLFLFLFLSNFGDGSSATKVKEMALFLPLAPELDFNSGCVCVYT